ncbi:MAG: transcriptional repressor LexA [Actinomycetota bacterium]|nr:transcriptional repressor LexA [Actinomycetota bacterium]
MRKNIEISDKQTLILEFILSSLKSNGYPPTVREIAKSVGLSSSATVYSHLKKLEKMGYIKRDPSKPRAIEILSKANHLINPAVDSSINQSVMVPLVGTVAAGTPILAEENIEDYFPLCQDFVKGNNPVFLLRVRGDSMVNAGILDRDYIIVRKQDTAINGEIVVALMEDESTVKRYFKTSKNIKLMPENDHMQPIITKNVSIIGKVIGVVRKYF